MILRLSRLSGLALSAFVVSGCVVNNGSTMPGAPGFSPSAAPGYQSAQGLRVVNPSAQPMVTCPQRYLDCVTVSKKKGADLIWCYGPSSDPCAHSKAGKVKWSGIVCVAKGKTCKKPIKQLTAKWSGPFKCKAQDKCTGTFELDTIKPGPGLKETKRYVYKQDIHISCSGCADAYVGLNVGP